MKEIKNENVYEYGTECESVTDYEHGTVSVEEEKKEQEPVVNNGKKPRPRFRNVLAIVLVIIFGTIFSVGCTGTIALSNTGASIEESLNHVPYYSLQTAQYRVEHAIMDQLRTDMQEDAFWVDGVYDENQVVDITKLYAGIFAEDKNLATSYTMHDLVIMYNNSVDDELWGIIETAENTAADYPEIIAKLEENYQTDEYYKDNQGNLYAARFESEATSIEEFLEQMPLDTEVMDVGAEYGLVLFILGEDEYPSICYELPEGSEYLEPVSWEEFSARYMLGLHTGNTELTENIDYGEYGTTFQYLYKHGTELEIMLPLSEEPLSTYALMNPAEVSLMDCYKQLADAIAEVGYAVTNEEYEQVDNTINVNDPPVAYYWINANGCQWTNNPYWGANYIDAIKDEVLYRQTDQESMNEYPMYYAKVVHAEDGDRYEEIYFASDGDVGSYSYLEMMFTEEFGIENAEYVVALNPDMEDEQKLFNIDYDMWWDKDYYTNHVAYMPYYLAGMAVGGIGVVLFFILAIVWAGKRDKTKARYAGPFATNIPIEVLLIVDVILWVLYAAGLYLTVFNIGLPYFGDSWLHYLLVVIVVVGFLSVALWEILILVTKGRSRNMRTNSLIGRAGRGVVDGIVKGSQTSAFTRKCPIEIMLAIFLACWIVYGCVIAVLFDGVAYMGALAMLICVCIALGGGILLALWHIVTLVHKGRSRNMKTNSIIGKCGGGIVRVIRQAYGNRKITGKLVLWSILFAGISLIFVGLAVGTYAPGIFIFLLIVFWVVTIGFLMKKCVQRQRVKEGLHEIAGGHLEYQIELDKLSGDDLDMARDLNNLKEGMENAVERMMKSERMKTDLITNVSHDLKTPLTSIINYVDILKKEDIQDEKIRGYIEILEQKSLRLKNLTEDLMEAAKISSGNITLDMQNINLKQLLYQTNAEFEEKFARRNLSLVCTLPDSDVYIKADSRRIWRVVENLYNNAAKYAQPYSRVYVDGKLQSGKVILIIKNVSEAPLNISADELMERFVRGDVARNTEGSGLGLEIARNLTVMQKGTFEIQLDGDLFKVVLTFDAV